MDVQYPATIARNELKKAFVSWQALSDFIDALATSLYNGAYIDEYRFTKNIISSAYSQNNAPIVTVTAPTTEQTAKEFLTIARGLFLNFQSPSSNYNAWAKVGGYGRPVTTFAKKEDIVFIIRNDISAYIDVNVLASAFNLDKATLLGNIITVDNFDIFDDDGDKIFDGSDILGLIADKSWFRIKKQDEFMDTFYNPNNRSWQYYLNLIKMYNYSLFANGVIIATSNPTVTITGMSFVEKAQSVPVGTEMALNITTTPITANTPNITYESSDATVVTVTANGANNKQATIKALKAGSATITAKAGNVTTTVEITVTAVAG